MEERALRECHTSNKHISEDLQSCRFEVEEIDKISPNLLRDLMNTDNFLDEFERLGSSVGTNEEAAGIDRL